MAADTLAVASAIALVFGVGTAAAPAASAAVTHTMCENTVVIGVHGTDAPVGTSLAHSNRVWLQGGFGDQLSKLNTKLINGSDIPYYFESLNYPASGGTPYRNSSLLGARSLAAEVNYVANACGATLPNIVLAGHSQGAHVIDLALAMTGTGSINANGKVAIRAVALFGDPSYENSATWDVNSLPNDGTFGTVAARFYDPAALDQYKEWGWPMGGTGPGWQYKIRSWCYANDMFCQNNLGGGTAALNIHNSYGQNMGGAYDWIDYQVLTFD